MEYCHCNEIIRIKHTTLFLCVVHETWHTNPTIRNQQDWFIVDLLCIRLLLFTLLCTACLYDFLWKRRIRKKEGSRRQRSLHTVCLDAHVDVWDKITLWRNVEDVLHGQQDYFIISLWIQVFGSSFTLRCSQAFMLLILNIWLFIDKNIFSFQKDYASISLERVLQAYMEPQT